jgi:hypothetical protein
MSFPAFNTTCDILHYGSSSPDASGVSLYLVPDWKAAHDAAISSTSVNRWTHVGYVGASVDIRDAYAPPAIGEDGIGTGNDTIYVPSFPNGTAFSVIAVLRVGKGSSGDHKRVYLQRNAIASWPTNNL